MRRRAQPDGLEGGVGVAGQLGPKEITGPASVDGNRAKPVQVSAHLGIGHLRILLGQPPLQRRLQHQGLERVMAVRYEALGKAWLWRTELGERAYDAFQAVGMRPPPRVQTFG